MALFVHGDATGDADEDLLGVPHELIAQLAECWYVDDICAEAMARMDLNGKWYRNLQDYGRKTESTVIGITTITKEIYVTAKMRWLVIVNTSGRYHRNLRIR